MAKRKNILPQMFDVKPVSADGSLNLEKIKELKRIVALSQKNSEKKIAFGANVLHKKNNLRLADVSWPKGSGFRIIAKKQSTNRTILSAKPRLYPSRIIRHSETKKQSFLSLPAEESRIGFRPHPEKLDRFFDASAEKFAINSRQSEQEKTVFQAPIFSLPKTKKIRARKKILRKNIFKSGIKSIRLRAGRALPDFEIIRKRKKEFLSAIFPQITGEIPIKSYVFSFAAALIIFVFAVPAFSFFQNALEMKTKLAATGEKALGQFAEAKNNLANSQFDKATMDFSESFELLSEANEDLEKIGGKFSEILRFVPVISKVASANYVVSAGSHFALAGKNLSESAKSLDSLGNPLDTTDPANQPSLTDLFLNLRSGIEKSSYELADAQNDLDKVNIDDLPAEIRDQFFELKSKLPIVNDSLKNFLDYSQIFLDILGYNGPRKYLFLFENNQEMRATGGFIGSYGILDISNGRVKKLFVDNIYNPDGQLRARVIPPAPIQKMSAVWTMHDANWFPNFPTSAEKVAWFYEKTGGPTVDGVVAITPELLRDLLEVTGPIDMPEYETVINAENFIENTQYEVEVDFDKEENQPKKIIADLTPKILDKVMSDKGISHVMGTLKAFNTALSERHMLLYSRNYNIQKLISEQKWSGEILNTDKDYLSVVNTNINGFKTDGVIDETIEHHSDIQEDGSIIDTVSVTRRHKGGNEKFDWWNKVNGDWMRIYVPKDAKLLEVSGQTRETIPPALDYNSLGFKRDPQVQTEEDLTRIDEDSGTKIYEENNKTVFANWVYVSPGESVTINYKYILPFKLSFETLHHPVDSFSILYQKQSGSMGSKLISQISLPKGMKTIWRWPDDLKQNSDSYRIESVLNTDKFLGLAIEK